MSESRPGPEALAQHITWGTRKQELTAQIESCACVAEVKAGLFLMNGDWQRAHEVTQSLTSPTGNHWHALVHRHEPDYDNSKYWLRRAGDSPIYSRLAEAAAAEGYAKTVAPGGRWDPLLFTDAYADPDAPAWTRRLDELEMRELLHYTLHQYVDPHE